MAKLVNLLAGLENNENSISNSELASLMGRVSSIGQTILNVIYIVLGIFLVIKGALLGMQIVKAADEPQVRQEKIGSLKWLVIGVVIAYGVAAIANVLVRVITSSIAG